MTGNKFFSYLNDVLLHISFTILCLESYQFLGKYENINLENNGKFIVLIGDFAIRVISQENMPCLTEEPLYFLLVREK